MHIKQTTFFSPRIGRGLWFQLMRSFKRISRISLPVNLPRDIRVFCFNFALSIKGCGRFTFVVVKTVHEYRSIDENLLTLRFCSESSL